MDVVPTWPNLAARRRIWPWSLGRRAGISRLSVAASPGRRVGLAALSFLLSAASPGRRVGLA